MGLWRKGVEGEKWLEGADWVVDAIDNINTKVRSCSHPRRSILAHLTTTPQVDLLEYCHKKELKVSKPGLVLD